MGLGVALRFLVPIPAGITVQAWTLLSIFVSAIVGQYWTPSPTQSSCYQPGGRPRDEQTIQLASQQHTCALAVCFPHTRLLTAELAHFWFCWAHWAHIAHVQFAA